METAAGSCRRLSTPPTPSSGVTIVFTRRPDAAMRCNFRFRLELVAIVVCFVIASTAVVSSSPISGCRKSEPQSFDDVVSRAVLANVVFEGYVTSVRHPAIASVVTSSSSLPADVETSCHVTFKVKRLLKGELSQQSSSTSPSSNASEFSPVVVRTQPSGGASDGSAGNAEHNWCASASVDGTSASESSRSVHIVFLTNAEDDVVDRGHKSSGSTSKPPRRNSRGSSSRGGAAVVYRFSSPPLLASKSVVKQLTNISHSKFGEC